MSQVPTTAREQILDAAVKVLQQEGPVKLTQTRVAQAAGLRQGHLTYYFPRKSDLWIATAEHAHDLLERELGSFFESEGWRGAGPGHREKMVALVTHLVKDRQRTRLMLSLVMQGEEDPELAKVFRATIRRARGLIAVAFGNTHSLEEIELTLTTFWGLGIRFMLLDGHEENDMTDRLVQALFDRLDQDAK